VDKTYRASITSSAWQVQFFRLIVVSEQNTLCNFRKIPTTGQLTFFGGNRKLESHYAGGYSILLLGLSRYIAFASKSGIAAERSYVEVPRGVRIAGIRQ